MSTDNTRFRVIFTAGAGPFRCGDEVTAEQIRKAGHNLARWIELQVVETVPAAAPSPVADTKPRSK